VAVTVCGRRHVLNEIVGGENAIEPNCQSICQSPFDDLVNVSACDIGKESAIDINGKDNGAIFSKLKFGNVELSDDENRVKV
jgi:hypothetical protein